MRELFTSWWLCPSSAVFAHGTPAAASLALVLTEDAAGSKLLCRSAPSPLGVLPGKAFVNTSDFVPSWNENLKHWKKTCRTGSLFPSLHWCLLVSSSLSAAAPFLLVENQISSLIPLDLAGLASCLKWWGWFFLVAGLFLMRSLTMWHCWEITNVLPSEPQVELVVSVMLERRRYFRYGAGCCMLDAAQCLPCLTLPKIPGILCSTAPCCQNSCSPSP